MGSHWGEEFLPLSGSLLWLILQSPDPVFVTTTMTALTGSETMGHAPLVSSLECSNQVIKISRLRFSHMLGISTVVSDKVRSYGTHGGGLTLDI